MDALSNDPLLSKAAGDLAVDSRALDRLKRDAARDPRGAITKAAQQFEALFMQMVLKSMRDATPKSGMLDSTANDMYTGMLDQQIAGKIAATGTGLADLITKQLTRHIKPPRDGSAGAAAPATATPGAWTGAAGAAASLSGSGSAAALSPSAPPAASDQHGFVSKLWDHAMSAASATGLPARFILGQAALESGWGKHEIRGADGVPSYNLFGIKAGANWKGRTVDVATTEYVNGVAQKKTQTFRAYGSYAESFLDWAQQMVRNPRYAGVLASAGNSPDGGGFAAALQRAGYATDPAYASKLTHVIRSAPSLRSSA